MKIKKLLSIVLSVMLVFVVLPLGSLTTSAASYGYFTYTVSNGNATITGLNTDYYPNELVIPDKIYNYPVTTIGRSAFYCCDNITSITLGKYITNIRASAFCRCEGLVIVEMGDSVINIGEDAFNGCQYLRDITIPNSVTSIGASAFYGCSTLTDITIPNSVTNIGESAFKNCDSLTDLKIGNTISNDNSTISLGDHVFSDCDSLRNVSIGSSVKSIPEYAFSLCIDLYNLIIPDSVTNIAEGSFYGTKLDHSLANVYYTGTEKEWDSISIGSYNSPLTDAEVNFEYTYFSYDIIGGKVTITNCDENFIGELTVPNTLGGYPVTSIDNYAFDDGITKITIPSSVTNFESSAFTSCYTLEAIYIENNNSVYSSENGVLFNKDKTSLIYYPIAKKDLTYEIPHSVKTLESYSFWHCKKIQNIIICDGVIKLKKAFVRCTSLTSITVPDSVETIYSDEFYGCDDLTVYCNYGSVSEIISQLDCTYRCLGDFNGDEKLDSTDIVSMRRAILGKFFVNDEKIKDINQDNIFNICDLVCLRKQLSKLNVVCDT